MSQQPAGAPTLRDYFGVSLYWLALSFFWGAMLVMVLPARAEQLFGVDGKDAALALVVGIGAAVAAASQVFFGALSDIVGFESGRRRPYLFVGTVLASVPLLLFPGADTLWHFIGVYVLIQLLINIAIGPYQALIPDRIPLAFHGRASAFMGAWTLLGRIGGPAVAASFLGSAEGFRNLMIVFIILLNACMLVNLGLIREGPAERNNRTRTQVFAEIAHVPLRPYPSFVWILVARFGINMGLYTVLFCLYYFVRYALGVSEGAVLDVVRNFMILSTITGLVAIFPAGRLADRYSKKTVLYAANSVSALAGFAFLLSGNLTLAYVAAGVFGVGMAAFQAVDWALGCNLLPEHARAKYLGVWGLSDTVPQIVAPFIAAPIAIHVNRAFGTGSGYRALMVLAMVYFIAGTLAIRPVRERRPEPQAV